MIIILEIISVICIICTIMPFLASKKWWVRGFDFPLSQVFLITLICVIIKSFNVKLEISFTLIIYLLLVIALLTQIYIIYPYTPFYKKRISDVLVPNAHERIKIISSNVLQDNLQFHKLIDLINKENPDLFVVLEVDKKWINAISVLKNEYPNYIEYPLDNYYGIAMYSKYPLKDIEIKFLIDDAIPSIHGSVQLPNRVWIKLFCLHPMPPSPTENEKSLDRDAELLMVARSISDHDYPVVVLGDLNDVAWSHTTRLFQRISRLLDPRIGRGFYNTFHVSYPMFRWPLDHLFVSNDFKLGAMKVLPSVGSDHFPIMAELYYKVEVQENCEPEQASKCDEIEADKTINDGLDENNKDEAII